MEVDGRWIGGEFAYVSEHKAATDLKTNLAFPGDIMVTQRGTLGQVSIIPENIIFPFLVISQSQMAISVDRTKVDRNFVYYFLRSPAFADYSHNQTIQTGVPHINLGILRSAPAEFPNLNQQREIAAILGALDDKIELNRKTAATLEEMARALYRSWFVDFDPVHAKAAGFAPAHMDAATAALFPDRFGDDGLPEGWKIIPLGEIVEPRKGKSITKKTIVSGNVPVVAGGLQPAYFHNVSNVSGPAITVSASGANAGFVRLYHDEIWASDCSFISREQTPYPFTVYALLSLKQADIYLMQQGAAQPHIYPSDLKRVLVVDPPREIWNLCESLFAQLFAAVANFERENRTLAALRDTLLPRLMSGELRVGEARERVEEVI